MRQEYKNQMKEARRIYNEVFSPEQRALFAAMKDRPGDVLEIFHLKNGVIKHYRDGRWTHAFWPPPVPGKVYKYLQIDIEIISESEARIIIANDAAASAAEDAAKKSE